MTMTINNNYRGKRKMFLIYGLKKASPYAFSR